MLEPNCLVSSPNRKSLFKSAGRRFISVKSLSADDFIIYRDKVEMLKFDAFFVNSNTCMRDFLGQEFDCVAIFFAPELSLNILFGVVSTLRSGGVLLVGFDASVELPPLHENLLNQLISYQRELEELTCESLIKEASQREKFLSSAFKETASLARSISSQLLSHSVVCITAPRGYGKSTMLGHIINHLKESNIPEMPLYLCAPSRRSVSSIYAVLDKCVDIKFLPPEDLSTLPEKCIVLIDEAANCSQKFIIENYARFSYCLLSTTTDGYEGQAQGFLYFIAQAEISMAKLAVSWRNSENDLLQKFQQQYVRTQTLEKLVEINKPKLKLLSVEKNQSQTSCIKFYAQTSTSWSSLKGTKRKQVIELLAVAHYRTTPNDLAMLINDGSCRYILVIDNREVIGVIVWQLESIQSNPLDIIYGTRRPKGNLLLQSLLYTSADLRVSNLKAARIIRIAVKKSYRRGGIATNMVTKLETELKDNVDIVGASFSEKLSSAQFWTRTGYQVVNVGLRKSPWLSSHSIMVCKANDERYANLVRDLESKCTNFLWVFRPVFANLISLFHVKQRNRRDSNFNFLAHSIISVLNGNRDLVYLLAELAEYFRQGSSDASQEQESEEAKSIIVLKKWFSTVITTEVSVNSPVFSLHLDQYQKKGIKKELKKNLHARLCEAKYMEYIQARAASYILKLKDNLQS